MIWQEWNKIIKEFENRKIRIICTDGTAYEGLGGEYCEAEDSNGDNVYAIILGNDMFLSEDVEKIEFLD